jgi:hypothetical protein
MRLPHEEIGAGLPVKLAEVVCNLRSSPRKASGFVSLTTTEKRTKATCWLPLLFPIVQPAHLAGPILRFGLGQKTV